MDKLLALLKSLGAKDEDIEAAKAEFEAAKEADVKGLKDKNAELLAKNRKLAGEEGSKVSDLEAQIDKLAEDNAKIAKVAQAAESKRIQAEKERDEKVASSEGAIQSLLIDGGLTSALAGKVKPAHMEAVKLLLSRDLSVKADGTSRKAVARIKADDGTEKELEVTDHVTAWLTGAIGKEFALDQGGGGGGAAGSGGNAAGAAGGTGQVLGKTVMESLSLARGGK